MAPQVTSRTERRRQATLLEIRTTARKLLTTQGASAVTINAVAREMGLSGPALYRYYASYDELVEAVIADFYQELAATMEAARDVYTSADANLRFLATCRAMRGWAITHPTEFGWMFASPISESIKRRPDSPRHAAGQNFERVFLEQIVELWKVKPYPVPRAEDLAPSLREQMQKYSHEVGGDLPPEAMHVFLSGWVRLYGLLCMEVLNQLDFAYTDIEPVFEECLRDLCVMHGLSYEPPEPA